MTTPKTKDSPDPNKKLWTAVLMQAVKDLKKGRCKGGEYQPAIWFNDTNEDIQSFIGICETLNIDPDKTRTAIFNLVKNK